MQEITVELEDLKSKLEEGSVSNVGTLEEFTAEINAGNVLIILDGSKFLKKITTVNEWYQFLKDYNFEFNDSYN